MGLFHSEADTLIIDVQSSCGQKIQARHSFFQNDPPSQFLFCFNLAHLQGLHVPIKPCVIGTATYTFVQRTGLCAQWTCMLSVTFKRMGQPLPL